MTSTHWALGLLCAGLFQTYLCSSVPGASLETLCPIHTRWATLTLVHGGEKTTISACLLSLFLWLVATGGGLEAQEQQVLPGHSTIPCPQPSSRRDQLHVFIVERETSFPVPQL